MADLVPQARSLRRNQTEAEKLLWYQQSLFFRHARGFPVLTEKLKRRVSRSSRQLKAAVINGLPPINTATPRRGSDDTLDLKALLK